MANALSVSSEEELLQLRNEGRITEDEYQDLLDAMRKAPPKAVEGSKAEADVPPAKRKRGKIAFTLMLIGLILPFICFLAVQMLVPEGAGEKIAPWFFLGVAFEVVAFALGVSSWPDVYGKATVITISVIAVFVLLIFVLLT
jgi:hypothetical protein